MNQGLLSMLINKHLGQDIIILITNNLKIFDPKKDSFLKYSAANRKDFKI
jgi:hypothetical protein